MTAGEFLTRLLVRYGVDHVFGIPGVHTLELYRALHAVSIRHITPRHEQGAGFMADGYARRSGKPGVCFIISGPGMTNTLTAMAQAFGDSIPMLVVSTVNPHGRMGSGDGWLHELPDQRALVAGVCAFSHTVNHVAELPQVLARAFAIFDSARPRPVHIEMPLNILAEPVEMRLPESVLRMGRPSINQAAARQAASILVGSTDPVILLGGGARTASAAITEFAEFLDAPVVMTVNARGIVAAEHPLAIGASASLPAVRELVAAADVVLAVGTEFGSTDYSQQIVRAHIPAVALVGDAEEGVLTLHRELTSSSRGRQTDSGSTRARQCIAKVMQAMSSRDRRYLELLDCIRNTLPEVTLVGDSTQIIYAGNAAFATGQPDRYFNSATGFGTLGYALPASIGAALADPTQPVVAIVGDGGLQFTMAELATAVDADVRLTLIVHQNGGYAEIRKFMTDNNVVPVGVDLLIPDFMILAGSCGWRTRQLRAFDELGSELTHAQKHRAPTLLLVDDSVFD